MLARSWEVNAQCIYTAGSIHVTAVEVNAYETTMAEEERKRSNSASLKRDFDSCLGTEESESLPGCTGGPSDVPVQPKRPRTEGDSIIEGT